MAYLTGFVICHWLNFKKWTCTSFKKREKLENKELKQKYYTSSGGLGDALSTQEIDRLEDTQVVLFYRLVKEMKQNALHMLVYHVLSACIKKCAM